MTKNREPWGRVRHLVEGDPMRPSPGDLIAEIARLDVGDPLPDGGWRVLNGNIHNSQIARVVMRHELEDAT